MSDAWIEALLFVLALLGLFIGAASAVASDQRKSERLRLDLEAADS